MKLSRTTQMILWESAAAIVPCILLFRLRNLYAAACLSVGWANLVGILEGRLLPRKCDVCDTASIQMVEVLNPPGPRYF